MTLHGYLLCIIGTTLFSAVITSVMPEGKTSAMIKGIARLVCVVSILSPIPQFLQKQSFFEFFQDKNTLFPTEKFSQLVITIDQPFIDYVSQMRVTVLEQQIQAAIEKQFQTQCEVEVIGVVQSETAELDLKKIILKLPVEKSDSLKHEICTYLQAYYDVEVEIGE